MRLSKQNPFDFAVIALGINYKKNPAKLNYNPDKIYVENFFSKTF